MEFSVLMSVYKNEKKIYFQASIESILEQSLAPTEIVIIKDGKLTEELESVCSEYKNEYPKLFKFIELPENRGLGNALAIALPQCKYDIVARMDTDDIAKPNRFEKQIREFEKDEDLAVLGSAIEEFSLEPGKVNAIRSVPLTHEEIYQYAKKRNPFNHMTVMFKKSAVQAVGSYQPFHFSEDYYLWFRLLYSGYKTRNLSDCLVSARVDKHMFQRRGGIKYFIQEVKLQNIFLESNFINVFEYVRNLGVRMITRLVPNIFREIIYKKYLRK